MFTGKITGIISHINGTTNEVSIQNRAYLTSIAKIIKLIAGIRQRRVSSV